jgi:hypothetical protein
MKRVPKAHKRVYNLLLKKYGKENVYGTGSRHPSLRYFVTEKSDIDVVVNTLDPLEKIKEWIEKKKYKEVKFVMKYDKVYLKGRHIADVIRMAPHNFPKKHILCEEKFRWVTPKYLLSEYRFHDESGKYTHKIKWLERLCGYKTTNPNINLTSNSPLDGNKQKRGLDFGDKSPQTGSKRKLDFGDKSPQTGSKRKLDFGGKSPNSSDNSFSKKLFC